MEMVQKAVRPLWLKLTKKTFNCPTCGQKLRVPIRPGKSLRVSCFRCPGQVILDFRIPFIELFRWQSGKSLKLNLGDIHHRFWNMPLQQKIHVFLWLFVITMMLDGLISLLFTSLSQFSSVESLPAVENTIRTI
jgi:hypothetical protein